MTTPTFALRETWWVLPAEYTDPDLDHLATETRHGLAAEYLIRGRLRASDRADALDFAGRCVRDPSSPVAAEDRDRMSRLLAWDSLRSLSKAIPGRRFWPIFRAYRERELIGGERHDHEPTPGNGPQYAPQMAHLHARGGSETRNAGPAKGGA